MPDFVDCVAAQIFNLIPPHLIGELAQFFGIHSQTFDERSHVFALLICQSRGTATILWDSIPAKTE